MRESLIAFVALAVVMLGGHYVFRRRRAKALPKHVPATDGAFTLRTPRKNSVMLGITALIPACLLGVLTYRASSFAGNAVRGFVPALVATLLVLAFAAYQFASAVRSHLVVRDTGIERVGVFRRRLLGWHGIARITFNPVQHWFFLTGTDGSRLWLPADIAGMGDFAEMARRRLPEPVLRAADPMVREVLDELAASR